MLAVQTGMVSLSSAQKREKNERIIIRRKGSKPEKMVIEIDGDKVKLNGKEVKDGDSNIIIKEFDADGFPELRYLYNLRAPMVHLREFRNRQGDWEHLGKQWQERSIEMQKRVKNIHEQMEKIAVPGVVTEKAEKGLKITEVSKGSAAEAAGLKEGDIITKVDAEEMNDTEDIFTAIRKHKPGDEVTVTYIRDGKTKSVKAILKSGKSTEDYDFNFNVEPFEMPKLHFENNLREFELREPFNYGGNGTYFFYRNRAKLGVSIQDTEDDKGVTVTEVDADSPASKNGIQKNDIITEINGKKVTGVNEAKEAMHEQADQKTWTIQLLRDGKPVTVEIKIPKELKKSDLIP